MGSRVLVVGGGIAGIETALWLSRGLPDVRVGVVSRWPELRILPHLVYVPFGMPAGRLDVPLAEPLTPYGIEVIEASVSRIAMDRNRVVLADGRELDYDVLVVAPGAESPATRDGCSLRTLDDALHLRRALEHLRDRPRPTVLLAVSEDNAWTAPAYELAMLLGTWRRMIGHAHLDVVLATPESQPFDLFSIDASDLVGERLRHHGIETLYGTPTERMDDFDADLVVRFDTLHARQLPGLPDADENHFYRVDAHGRVAPDVYVVGDAASTAYKAAFATSWQARRVLDTLGGSSAELAERVGAVPVHESEYQMDLGDRTLHVRFNADTHFLDPFLDPRATVWTSEQIPDKLEGTLVKELVLGDAYRPLEGMRLGDLIAAEAGRRRC